MSVNKVILIGNVGREPEFRTFDSGSKLATFTLATSRRWKDKNSGEFKEATEWHNIVANDRQAEIARDYIKTGMTIFVEGEIRTRSYTTQSGDKKYVTEIVAREIQMLDRKDSGNRSEGGQRTSQSEPSNDLPFD